MDSIFFCLNCGIAENDLLFLFPQPLYSRKLLYESEGRKTDAIGSTHKDQEKG